MVAQIGSEPRLRYIQSLVDKFNGAAAVTKWEAYGPGGVAITVSIECPDKTIATVTFLVDMYAQPGTDRSFTLQEELRISSYLVALAKGIL